jgi:hypothetical protein
MSDLPSQAGAYLENRHASAVLCNSYHLEVPSRLEHGLVLVQFLVKLPK